MAKFFSSLFGKGHTQTASPDDYPIDAGISDKDLHAQVSEYLQGVVDANAGWKLDVVERMAAEHPILKASPEEQLRTIRILAMRMAAWYNSPRQDQKGAGSFQVIHINYALDYLFNRLVRRSLAFTAADLAPILKVAAHTPLPYIHHYSWGYLINQIEKVKNAGNWDPAFEEPLKTIRVALERNPNVEKRLLERIDTLTGQSVVTLVEPFEPWSDTLMKDMTGMEAGRARWEMLITHILVCPSSKPGPKWLGPAQKILDEIGTDTFRERTLIWFRIAAENTGKPMPERSGDVLRGLVLTASFLSDEPLSRAIGNLANACYLKIPGHGPRSKKVGNACVYALSAMPGMVGIHELARIRQKAKYADVQAWIGEALEEAAKRLGLTSGELEDLSVPDYGLDRNARRRESFGGDTAEIAIEPGLKLRVAWTDASGKALKSPPQAAKRDFPDEYADFQKAVEGIEQSLSAQRDRLERALIQARTWRFPDWKKYYLEHPLMSQLTRLLVWHFQDGVRSTQAIWKDGKLTDLQGQAVEWPTPETQVQLWHPLGFPAETLCQWRRFLEEAGVTQPFKQAHREVYVLTDAELDTQTYSNRFAAHILKQHQLAALCRQRGWIYALQGGWDSTNWPTYKLPEAGLEAQFVVEGVFGEGQLASSGVCLYVSTDQVRFVDTQKRAVQLTEVPALIFSEVMRDVDLFVGVCSVGADPTWRDQGGIPAYAAYWERFAFGDLTATAEIRRDALRRLIPRLKIAPQCEIQGRFLVVRGKRRTYKIHIGSGNVLMEPNDRYLSIDLYQDKAGKDVLEVFLPFEGDLILSLVLNKSFMLAQDDKITDPTIVKQIEAG